MRTFDRLTASGCALLLATGLTVGATAADDPAPSGFEYEWGADIIGAGFFGSGSWFGESSAFLGAETDQWLEFGFEPKFSFEAPAGKGTAFGQVSAIWTYTSGDDASGLTIGLDQASEITLEQANVGWRAEDVLDSVDGETFTVTVGNLDYRIGSGMLILDGGGDGAERGGWYLGMRKAFHQSLLLQLKTDDWLLEGFRLANHPRQGGTEGDVVGANAERSFGGIGRFGGTFMHVDANLPGPPNSMNVFSLRYDLAPEEGFGISAEYAKESGDQIEAFGYFAQVSYTTSSMAWSPVFSYRFADFSGDDPLTAEDERFREVAYGYTDYGSWYQGEITGNYPLGNGNLQSHLLRMKVQPRDDLTLNVLYYQFSFNEPAALGLTSDDWGDEVDFTADWAVNDELYLIGVLAILSPGQAAVQMTGGTDDWVYAMLYASYAW